MESYKTLDDANLLKTGDIGQVLLVGGELAPGQIECRDGVTPPMRNARERHFKQLPQLDNKVVQSASITAKSIRCWVCHDLTSTYSYAPPPTFQVVNQVENDLMNILAGGAPHGYEYHDVEEEYVVDPETGAGSWQRAKPQEAPKATTADGDNGDAEGAGPADGAGDGEKAPKPSKPKKPKVKKPKVVIPDEII